MLPHSNITWLLDNYQLCGSQSLGSGPASAGNLEIEMLASHPRTIEPETLGVRPGSLWFNKPLR